ncbi:MAG: phosphate signaling complex protein PhoU [Sphingomonadaceae bacterium]|nr:phosphate signaling complex protein PhoU [Sphingomonadaceae bacterium]
MEQKTPRPHVTDDLHQLRAIIGRMGGLAEAQITAAIDSLARRDADSALAVVPADKRIDALELEAEQLAIATIAARAPAADDLRALIAAIKIAGMLERIGDYATNIAKRVSVLVQSGPVQPAVIVPEMGRAVAQMVKDALDAYADGDAELAAYVCERDRIVDDFYASLFRSLLTYMMEHPHHITPSAHLLFIAKNLERVGDHATNIAEVVYFSVTGEHLDERPKRDFTSLAAPPAYPR